MLYVYLTTGDREVVPRAQACRIGNRHVLCVDRAGHVVRRFPVENVTACTKDPIESSRRYPRMVEQLVALPGTAARQTAH